MIQRVHMTTPSGKGTAMAELAEWVVGPPKRCLAWGQVTCPLLILYNQRFPEGIKLPLHAGGIRVMRGGHAKG